MFGTSGAALSSGTGIFCLTASPAPTVLDATAVAAGAACNGGPYPAGQTKIEGGLGALNPFQTMISHILIPNSSTQTVTCFGALSASGIGTLYGYCAMKVEPY
jgi:hypothetical protein